MTVLFLVAVSFYWTFHLHYITIFNLVAQVIFHHASWLVLSHTKDILNYNSSIVLPERFFKLLGHLGLYLPEYSQLYWECSGKYTPSSTGSIFHSTLPVELDLYGKILLSWLSNTGKLNFNIYYTNSNPQGSIFILVWVDSNLFFIDKLKWKYILA